ncbi:macrolide ABC transporter ATP-binding protein/permease MacB [Candidatus Arsenophonus triatominarum]|uniref:macrolide ABC transporter ATP-binding protein/permease MacB n=1 Tax=Candidatus Arsenophonus triatominarum TaxID=57911 RepID=UPI0007C48FE6|nr:macrolide ABC transporter ATP-binding protein/permease MacB [Candidatus Arsenophonus triatominarum]
MSALLELSNIGRNYRTGEQQVKVLENISLTINAGEMVAIVGVSGSGKSTLMNILGCLDKPSYGEYYLAGKNIAELDDEQLSVLRREYFGFIFQRYHLLPYLTAEQNVEIPAIYAGTCQQERRKRAIGLLARLGLSDRIKYYPTQLSGGQQQRVSIARALINGGQIILADEPTGALDSHSGDEVIAILKQLCQQGYTVILVTHNMQIAVQAERIIEIKNGEIIRHSVQREPTKILPPIFSVNKQQISMTQRLNQFREALLMAWRAILINKMRTLLTMLGIIIGIASVVSILVIGNAAKRSVLADIQSIATNTITVFPGKGFSDVSPQDRRALTISDVDALQKQPYVFAISGKMSTDVRLRYGNRNSAASAFGVGESYFDVYAMSMSEGIILTSDMVKHHGQVIVIDKNTKDMFFPKQKQVVGEIILVGNMPVTIVGVAAEQKSVYGNSNMLQIWMPYTTMSSRLMNRSYFDNLYIRIKQGYSSLEAEQQLTRLLTVLHGKKDIFTYNFDTLIKTIEKTTNTLQLFLTLVAVISLLVGGIGVMNIMLVSVTERTKEIGIRIAIGARNSDIMQQFLIEAIFICLFGGFLGILLSYIVALIARLLLPDWQFAFSLMPLLGALVCSTIIGLIFGFLPARNAAKLNPVDALARE